MVSPDWAADQESEQQQDPRSANPRLRPDTSIHLHLPPLLPVIMVLVAAAFYSIAAYKTAVSEEPFIDEGWLASPAYNLAFHGFMGTTVLEPTGSWLNSELKGIHEYTYWVMPLHLLAQAAWYRIFGFGLVQMRLLSAVWGAIALGALYFIVERLTRNSFAASLAVLLSAFDFTFIWSAADGRMDTMCLGLGFAGLAAYLLLREESFFYSLIAGNGLMAASIFTHPNGVIWALFLVILVFSYDRKRLQVKHLWAVAPYAVFAAGWGMYIAKRPDYFLAQFTANSNPPSGPRGEGFIHPDRAAYLELHRYWSHFRHPIWAWPGWPHSIWIPVLYWMISILAYLQFRRTRERALGTVFLLLVLCVFMMTFADSLKAENYLVMVMPLYAAVAAVWVSSNEYRRKRFLLGCGLLAAILVLQTTTLVEKLRVDPLRDAYRPVVAFLKTLPAVQVDGDAVLGFELGYQRLTDDARMGLRSGRRPEVVVVDRWYQFDYQNVFPHSDMLAYFYTRRLMEREYHPVFTRGNYTVYELNTWSPPASAPLEAVSK